AAVMSLEVLVTLAGPFTSPFAGSTMKRYVIFLSIGLVAGFAPITDGAAAQQPGNFKITTKKMDDTIEVQGDKDKTVFVVKSPSGIGQAVIELKDMEWPKTVVLKL